MMWLWFGGLVAGMISYALALPPSRELVMKLGTLIDWAERSNPAAFAVMLQPISPFQGKKFVHARISRVLKCDLSEFGEICQRLQRESRKLDRKAHIGMIPFALYALSAAVWWFAFKP